DVVFAQQGDEALAQEQLVLDDDYAHGSSTLTVVPRPGGLAIRSVPSRAATLCRRPRRPPPPASAPPGPVSAISILSDPPSRRMPTRASASGACLATLVSDSATTK